MSRCIYPELLYCSNTKFSPGFELERRQHSCTLVDRQQTIKTGGLSMPTGPVVGVSQNGPAVSGESEKGIGVSGIGLTVGVEGYVHEGKGHGVHGHSKAGHGIFGISTELSGVKGVTYGSSPEVLKGAIVAGVWGENWGTGPGVYGKSQHEGNGVSGEYNGAGDYAAVSGEYSGTGDGSGVVGKHSGNGQGNGVEGEYSGAGQGSGVVGEYSGTGQGSGVVGKYSGTGQGYGVVGKGSKAGLFEGSVDVHGAIVVGNNAAFHGTITVDGTSTLKGNVEAAGNLGIAGTIFVDGPSTLNDALGVAGTVTAHDFVLSGADCAEDFSICSSTEVEPGTVMVIGDQSTLNPSLREYDRRVVGVLSGAGAYKPGIVLDRRKGQGNRMPVALLGKVYCKADAAYSPIAVGDLLTTSPTPGHAMRATNPAKAFGAVLGKALGKLENGKGLIPVLVALQ
jgi:hypothetical protein